MKEYKKLLTTTVEMIANHFGKEQLADISTSFTCAKCSTDYLCFSSSDLILYKNAKSNGWKVYGVREEDETLETICDCT